MVMEVVHEDIGEGNVQCTDHPYKNSTAGGICAFCLQEKLGKLVSSSLPLPISSSTSSSSSPAVTSLPTATTNSSTSLQVRRRVTSFARLPFILTQRKKKNIDGGISDFKRSKSLNTPRGGIHFLDENSQDYTPHKRGFWSFLYLSKHSSTTKKIETHYKDLNFPSNSVSSVGTIKSRDKKKEEFLGCEGNESPRKISRSRSVGCGSRSFSSDFFDRISTGFGDCTLRRVESHREGKSKLPSVHKNGDNNEQVRIKIKDKVKCGRIFSGFNITPSSSSSSSSSYCWASSSTEGTAATATVGNLSRGRSKSWGWTFASPMRAFSKPSKRDSSSSSSNKITAPNLAAIPSLLAV